MKGISERQKFTLKYFFRKNFRQHINNMIESTRFHTEKKSDNGKTYLVIERKNRTVGIFSDYLVFLSYIEKAICFGMIPVIDRSSTPNMVLDKYDKRNTWEIFFEQPLNVSLDKMQGSVKRCYTMDFCWVSLLKCQDSDTINYWRLIARKYIRFNVETKNYLEKYKKEILCNKRVLGVCVREGYIKLMESAPDQIRGHAIQPKIELMIADAEKYSKDWNCEFIFVTCQTNKILQQFRDKFGERLLFVNRTRIEWEDLELATTINNRDQIQNEKDYITEIFLLSQCTSMICGQNGGAEAAFLMSDGYENFKCYNIGEF